MLTLEGISQYYIAFDDDIAKFSALKDLYEPYPYPSVFYCNTQTCK